MLIYLFYFYFDYSKITSSKSLENFFRFDEMTLLNNFY